MSKAKDNKNKQTQRRFENKDLVEKEKNAVL